MNKKNAGFLYLPKFSTLFIELVLSRAASVRFQYWCLCDCKCL